KARRWSAEGHAPAPQLVYYRDGVRAAEPMLLNLQLRYPPHRRKQQEDARSLPIADCAYQSIAVGNCNGQSTPPPNYRDLVMTSFR
ncbi:MAG: hypothetical protein ACR2H6_15625, partial [Pyrinomonadaceae bacterium]